MRFFLLVFFLLYGALHLHAFLKAKAAFDFDMRTGIVLALFFLFMVLAPVIIRQSENAGFELFARTVAYAGYTWMGILFLFFSASLLVDLYRLFVLLGGLTLHKDVSFLALSAKTSFLIPLAVSLCIAAYGYREALDIETEHITVETEKLPQGVDRIRIAQVSDVHLGLMIRSDRLSRILEKVKEANPDIFVSTGDLVDGQINGLQGLAELFRDINPKYGKYAVTGNHEYYAGIGQALPFIKAAGFTLLGDEGVNIGNLITLVGVDDPAANYSDPDKVVDEKGLLSSFPHERFTVLLKHRPLISKESVGLFDLQLSGHVHKGQIFPFSILTRLYYPMYAGMLNAGGSVLYVSRGSGTWGPPIRFLAPPEVTVIDIVRANGRKGPTH